MAIPLNLKQIVSFEELLMSQVVSTSAISKILERTIKEKR
jgi:hypothetical protein